MSNEAALPVVVCDGTSEARNGSKVACARSRATRRHAKDTARFVLQGEIDVANAGALLVSLRRVAGRHAGEVVVDCAELTFIDAAGIGALIKVHRELAQRGRSVRLCHPSPLLTRMLQALDLTHLLAPIPVAPVAA